MELQSLYQKAIAFAGEKHLDQKVPGTQSSYLLHLSNVAMETMIAARHTDDFDLGFAVQVAILHDILEDTSTTFNELQAAFGLKVADAVLALSKNEALESQAQIPDSLERIKLQTKEVWAVKLADRITNMQKPPAHIKSTPNQYHSRNLRSCKNIGAPVKYMYTALSAGVCLCMYSWADGEGAIK